MERRKIIVIGIGALAILVGTTAIAKILTTSTITISAPTAEIYVKQGGGEFKKLGQTSATYRTQSTGTVYIEARGNDRITQESITPKRRQNTPVDLKLAPTQPSTRIGAGPLLNPLVSGDFTYGINPNTNSLAVLKKDGSRDGLPALPTLPFLQRIIWFDKDNFVYVTRGRGVGVITNQAHDADAHSPVIYADAANAQNKTALVAASGLYMATGMDIHNATKIAEPTTNASPNVFTDGSRFYYTNLIFEESSAEELDPQGTETKVEIFGADGKKQTEFTVQIADPLFRVAVIDDSTMLLLASDRVVSYNTKTKVSNIASFSFGAVEDLAVVNKHVVLLGEAGMWEYIAADNEYRKLTSYPSGERYVKNSLTANAGSLLYSTQIEDAEYRKETTTARSSIYQLTLK